MAGEAGLSGRHSGMSHPLGRAMAEDAIDADARNVEIVPKWNGLVRTFADIPEPVGSDVQETACENHE